MEATGVRLNVAALPSELRSSNRAVLWNVETRDGKPTKVPYIPGRPGVRAASTDPATWGRFDVALEDVAAGLAHGIGIVLGDGLTGVDLDKCRDPESGEIDAWARAIVQQLDSYTEVSPSGRGVHILVRGKLPAGRRRKGPVEMYDDGRYFTLTGSHVTGTPSVIEERQSELEQLHAQTFASPAAATPTNGRLASTSPVDVDDAELIDRARAASNGGKFTTLWLGDHTAYPSHSEADQALCGMLAFWANRDTSRIDRLFRQSGLMRDKWDEHRGEQTYGQVTIARAVEQCAETYRGAGPARAYRQNGRKPASNSTTLQKVRTDILLRPELNAVTDEAIDAIAGRLDLGVYVRGRMLVTVARDGSAPEEWLRRAPGAPTIVPLNATAMLRVMDESARWLKWDAKKKVAVETMPPAMFAAQILARHSWPFPYLAGVIETPTIRPDGSILDRAGYDAATALLYEPAPGAQFPGIPNKPTKGEAERAALQLYEPATDFPFVADTDRSAFLAAILSLLARPLIDGPVPLFPIRAPSPGTGKGLLAKIIGIIGTGHEPAVMSMTEADELRKRVTALAVSGTPLILLDDVTGSLGSDVLAAALTATTWEDRLLGQTEMVRLPLRAVWLATGNNLGFQRTLGRRVVPIDLDAKVETPEDRRGFAHDDLPAFVRSRRCELVAAALTMLRAFMVAGAPRHGGARMGSFEQWDDVVRSCIMWSGFADPAASDDPTRGRGRIRAQADDDIADLAAMYVELQRAFGATNWTALDVWKLKDENGALRVALEAAAAPRRAGKGASLKGLRYMLRQCVDRPIRGLILVRASDPNDREQRWAIRESCTIHHKTPSIPATRGDLAVTNRVEGPGTMVRDDAWCRTEPDPTTSEGWAPDESQVEAFDE